MGAVLTQGFSTEADMLGLIAAAAPTLAGPGAVALFEVPSAAGVPDVIAAILDRSVITKRLEAGFVTEHAGLAVVLALSDAFTTGRALDARQVAAAAGISHRYAASRVLPQLVERGWATVPERAVWAAARRYQSPARRIVTVEAKLRDWKRGLAQAARHAAGAEAAWLVLDSARIRPAAAAATWFRSVGVGLAALNPDGVLQPLLSPEGARVLRIRRELLAERAAALYHSGAVSGPVSHVFGRELAPTKESDPRLTGVAAR